MASDNHLLYEIHEELRDANRTLIEIRNLIAGIAMMPVEDRVKITLAEAHGVISGEAEDTP